MVVKKVDCTCNWIKPFQECVTEKPINGYFTGKTVLFRFQKNRVWFLMPYYYSIFSQMNLQKNCNVHYSLDFEVKNANFYLINVFHSGTCPTLSLFGTTSTQMAQSSTIFWPSALTKLSPCIPNFNQSCNLDVKVKMIFYNLWHSQMRGKKFWAFRRYIELNNCFSNSLHPW